MFAKKVSLVILISGVVLLNVVTRPSSVGQAIALTQSIESIMEPGESLTVHSSRLSSEIQISLPTTAECDRTFPSVAYNWRHDEYLVVWQNTWWPGEHNDIYARRVSGSGELLSWFAVSFGSNEREQPSVTYNATNDEYLVVWMYNASGDYSTYEIWGRTIAWDGAYQDPEFQVITWTNRTFRIPRVAWNSFRNEYMVVWSAYDATTFMPMAIGRALLDADGNKIDVAIITSNNEPLNADVTYNVSTDEYLVVWQCTGTDGLEDIRGARLDADSGLVVVPPGDFFISSLSNDEEFPAVTTNENNRYLVVWQRHELLDWNICGRELDEGGSFIVDVPIATTSGIDEYNPAVATRSGAVRDYLVVWQRDAPNGSQICAYHRRDDSIEVFQVAATAFRDNQSPAVAWGKFTSLVVYDGDSTSDPTSYRHIYGLRWWPEAFYLPLIRKMQTGSILSDDWLPD